MNSQELRNLQEAYMDVYYELDERAPGFRFDYNQRHGRPFITPQTSQSASETETLGGGTYHRGKKRLPTRQDKYDKQVLSGVRAASDQEKERARKRLGITGIGENYDLYDIILSHLIDEGYAETPEAAEAIMVNMSEEWRESIVDEMLDEANRGDEYATRNMSPDAARKYKETRRNTQFVNNKPKAMRNYYGGRSSGDLTAMRQEQRPKKKPLARSAGYDPETRTRDPNKIPMGKYENMLDKKRNPQRSGGYYG